MKKIAITFLIILLVVLAGLLYWRPLSKNGEISITPEQEKSEQQEKTITDKQKNTKTQEKETATTTPYLLKGEISHGNPNKKQIIFTFDGGAGTRSAQKILAVAKKHGTKLTFFVTGKFAEKNSDLIKQMANEGHEIFNHTYSHPHLPQLTDEQIKEELNKAETLISQLTGTTTKPYFRPPYKERNDRVLKIASEFGYQSVIWTIDALDWMPDKTADQVKQQIYSYLQPGAIILMHIGDNITGMILDDVFTKIESEGYKIVSLTDGIK